jgi:hypothetical protein
MIAMNSLIVTASPLWFCRFGFRFLSHRLFLLRYELFDYHELVRIRYFLLGQFHELRVDRYERGLDNLSCAVQAVECGHFVSPDTAVIFSLMDAVTVVPSMSFTVAATSPDDILVMRLLYSVPAPSENAATTL